MAILGTAWGRVAAMACGLAAAAAAATAQTQPAPLEASVRAVFLYNFSKYVAWPPARIGERSPGEVRICVTADDEFFALLRAAAQGETIDGRPLVPVVLTGLDDARTCQILYVGDARSADARDWLTAVRGAQVLTVADGVLDDEPIIGFVRDDDRLRFDINRAAASRHGLNVSAKLLRLARHVRDR